MAHDVKDTSATHAGPVRDVTHGLSVTKWRHPQLWFFDFKTSIFNKFDQTATAELLLVYFVIPLLSREQGDVGRATDSWPKCCGLESWREFFSPELTFCADSYSVPFHPVVPQWHVKDPHYSAKSADGRLHVKTHTPSTQKSDWADYAVQA